MRRSGSRIATAGGLLALFVFLLPARFATLRGDDTWTFQGPRLDDLEGTSLLAAFGGALRNAFEQGRPQFLGGVVGELVVNLFAGHRVLYHLYLVALTVLAAALLVRLLARLGAPPVLCLAALVLLAGSIQFRAYHDAVLGYYGFLQIGLCLLLCSLLSFQRYLRGDGGRHFVLALVWFVAMASCYEALYSLCVLHLGLALHQRRGLGAIRTALPFFGLGLLFTLTSFLARSGSEVQPEGYETSTSIGAIFRTYVVQLFPPLPSSTRIFEAEPIGTFYPLGGSPAAGELAAGAWRAVVVAAVVAWVVMRLGGWAHRGHVDRRAIGGLVTLGAGLWLLPPLLVSLAPKYQAELSAGKGYLPVLIQVFGYAVIAAGFLWVVAVWARGRSRAALVVTACACALVAGYSAGVTGAHNVRLVALEVPVNEARDGLRDAAGDGLLSDTPAQATLLFSTSDTNWYTGSWRYGPATVESMLFGETRRSFDGRIAADTGEQMCSTQTGDPFPADCAPLSGDASWLRFQAYPGGAVAILAPVGAATDVVGARDLPARSVRAYRKADDGPIGPPLLTGLAPTGRAWTSAGLNWRTVRTGRDWGLYETTIPPRQAPLARSLTAAASRLDFAALLPPDQIVRIRGTSQLLP